MVVHAETLVIEAAKRAASGGQMNADTEDLLRAACGDMVVTPKEIDAIAEDCAFAVANGLNMALHPGLSLEEVTRFIH